MMTDWHFPQVTPATLREPIAGAFFMSDAIKEPGVALVREGIQNSLDATIDGEQTLIRISLITVDWKEAEPFFARAQAHYLAQENGLRYEDLPKEGESCDVLVFEDFGTCGLQGDPATRFPPTDDDPNDFFHFFRAEGRTDKGSNKRGSWGLGKDTFFRASRVNTLFGLTIRSDDGKCLLMGKTVLKSHWVDENFCQDGYFGFLRAPECLPVLPIEDRKAVAQFLEVFRLERQDETGLSIIVPWCDTDISRETILQAVFQNYFFDILKGNLAVIVEASDIQTLIEKSNLLSEARKYQDQIIKSLPIIELASWVMQDISEENRQKLNMPNPQKGWSWDEELIPKDIVKVLRGKLESQDHIAIRIPVTVRKSKAEPQCSYFDVYLKRHDTNERIRPIFIRDGIIISGVGGAPAIRGVYALVVIEDLPLSEFLRDAENPSHTVWYGEQVKKEYVSGVTDLRFVVRSVREIVNLVTVEAREENRYLIADLFPVPGRSRVRPTKKPPQPKPDPPPSNPRFFSIRERDGGFTITLGVRSIPPKSLIEIRVAYDVHRGNALSSYSTEDFRLCQEPIQCKSNGLEITECSDNRMIIRILQPDDFRLTVAGFDSNRQLYVRAEMQD